ncbi:hypothetical protein [Streptacidiphilus sp. EB103A]
MRTSTPQIWLDPLERAEALWPAGGVWLGKLVSGYRRVPEPEPGAVQ